MEKNQVFSVFQNNFRVQMYAKLVLLIYKKV